MQTKRMTLLASLLGLGGVQACGVDPLVPVAEPAANPCLLHPQTCGDADVGSDVVPGCGNGIAELGETCDGADLRGFTCASLAFASGTLACRPAGGERPCELDLAGCVSDPCTGDPESCAEPPECGNGVVELGEECDLGSAYNLGPPTSCNPNCTATATCGASNHWDPATSACISNSRQADCPAPPANAHANTATQIVQTWDGTAWQPPTTLAYDSTASSTVCRFTCNGGYEWDGVSCAQPYVEHAQSRCIPRVAGDVSTSDWYWIDSNGQPSGLRAACSDVPRGINCSDDDGCCSPNGVAINGDCVVYAGVGGYCYASPQCMMPLTCNIPIHTCE